MLRERILSMGVGPAPLFSAMGGSEWISERDYAIWEWLFPQCRSELLHVASTESRGSRIVTVEPVGVVPLSDATHSRILSRVISILLRVILPRRRFLNSSLRKTFALAVTHAPFNGDLALARATTVEPFDNVLIMGSDRMDPWLLHAAVRYCDQHVPWMAGGPLLFLKSGSVPVSPAGVAPPMPKFWAARAEDLEVLYPSIRDHLDQFRHWIDVQTLTHGQLMQIPGLGEVQRVGDARAFPRNLDIVAA